MQHPPEGESPEQPGMDPPDTTDPAENEVFCFLDHNRPCTGECMAYKTFPRENKHLERHQTHCVVLSTVETGARSLNIMAGLISQLVNKQKTAEADERRARAFGDAAPVTSPGKGKA